MNAWWKEGFVYQIYPRSFKDSNNDGIGDLKGIIEKLDYLQWLGIKAVWLNPVYQSPNDDMGYDISDYEAIMTEFGTMEDFDLLLEELHKRDIKLIMDLVVNHSSDEHAWFVESRKSKDNPYRDYYIWRPGKKEKEPNNWSSYFTPSAWSYDEGTDEWYLHLFSQKQPDLNWENEKMRNEIYDMINRWFDKGVDGFRLDVITLIAKKEGLPDGTGISNDEGYVFSSEHFAFQPKMYDYLNELRQKCIVGRNAMFVGEAAFITTQNAPTIVGKDKPLDLVFQFDLMDIDANRGKWDVIPFDIPKFKKLMSTWQKAIDWNALFWSNHDQPRTVSRFGNDATKDNWKRSAKMLGVAMHLLRGTSYIYQGEEIGMTNVYFKELEQLKDIESVNYMENAIKHGYRSFAWQGVLKKARDHARTPMQWNDDAYAGFSEVEPWMMVNPNYVDIHVKEQMNNRQSILYFYRKLIALKTKSKTLTYGNYQERFKMNPYLFSYSRTYQNTSYLIVCNMSSKSLDITLPKGFKNAKLVLSNLGKTTERLTRYEARVYKKKVKPVKK